MNDGRSQAGIAASDRGDDLVRIDPHQRAGCPGGRKSRLAGDAGITDGGSWQEYRAYQIDILVSLNIRRARSEVHSVSPPQRRFFGARQLRAGAPLVVVATARSGVALSPLGCESGASEWTFPEWETRSPGVGSGARCWASSRSKARQIVVKLLAGRLTFSRPARMSAACSIASKDAGARLPTGRRSERASAIFHC